jgi:hypothetical protein
MRRKRLALIMAAALALAVCGFTADAVQRSAAAGPLVSEAGSASEFSAQRRYRARRVRPQVTVRPGRLLYRRCAGWLAVEHRLSGTVIVPQERCWWVRG